MALLPNLPDPFRIEIINTKGKRDVAFTATFSCVNDSHHITPIAQMLLGLMPTLTQEQIETLFSTVTKDEVAMQYLGDYLIRIS